MKSVQSFSLILLKLSSRIFRCSLVKPGVYSLKPVFCGLCEAGRKFRELQVFVTSQFRISVYFRFRVPR